MDKIIKVIQEEKRFFSLFPDYEIISEKVDDVHVEAEYRVRLDNLRWLLKFAPKNIREQMFHVKSSIILCETFFQFHLKQFDDYYKFDVKIFITKDFNIEIKEEKFEINAKSLANIIKHPLEKKILQIIRKQLLHDIEFLKQRLK